MAETKTSKAQTPVPLSPDIRANDAHLTPEQKQTRVYEVFQDISEGYDHMNSIISAGRHKAWKRALIRRVAQATRARCWM